MKSCDQHDRCIVSYTEDWRSGQNNCPLCNLQDHLEDVERQHEKAIDQKDSLIDDLRDQLEEATEAA